MKQRYNTIQCQVCISHYFFLDYICLTNTQWIYFLKKIACYLKIRLIQADIFVSNKMSIDSGLNLFIGESEKHLSAVKYRSV